MKKVPYKTLSVTAAAALVTPVVAVEVPAQAEATSEVSIQSLAYETNLGIVEISYEEVVHTLLFEENSDSQMYELISNNNIISIGLKSGTHVKYETYVKEYIQDTTQNPFEIFSNLSTSEDAVIAKTVVDSFDNFVETQTLEAIEGTTVTIDGETYEVAPSLQDLFSNTEALKDAQIAVEVTDGTVTQVNHLEITASGTAEESLEVNGGDNEISGDLKVSGDNVSVANLTVKDDVEIQSSSFYGNGLTVEGETTLSDAATETADALSVESYATSEQGKVVFENSTMANVSVKKQESNVETRGTTNIQSVNLRGKSSFTSNADSSVESLSVEEEATEVSVSGEGNIAGLNLKGDAQVNVNTDKIAKINVSGNSNITAAETVTLPEISIEAGVTAVKIDGKASSVAIKGNEEVNLSGKAEIEKVSIESNVKVNINIQGSVQKLQAKAAGAKVSLSESSQVNQVEGQEGDSLEDIIVNIDEVADNVTDKNVEPVQEDDEEDGSGSTGGSVGGGTGGSGGNTGGGTVAYQPVANSVGLIYTVEGTDGNQEKTISLEGKEGGEVTIDPDDLPSGSGEVTITGVVFDVDHTDTVTFGIGEEETPFTVTDILNIIDLVGNDQTFYDSVKERTVVQGENIVISDVDNTDGQFLFESMGITGGVSVDTLQTTAQSVAGEDGMITFTATLDNENGQGTYKINLDVVADES